MALQANNAIGYQRRRNNQGLVFEPWIFLLLERIVFYGLTKNMSGDEK
tara:strand:+ start:9 stop:152 length:144 start_codon:yes stop_codon:yes gene_type:complete